MSARETKASLIHAITVMLRYAGIPVMVIKQPGCPELFAFSRSRGGWIGLQVKTAQERLSADLRRRCEAGLVHVVRSPEEAVALMTSAPFA